MVFRCIHGNSSVVNSLEFSYNNNGQESFQIFLQSPSLSVNVFEHKRYLPFRTEYVLLRGDGSSSSSDDDSNNGEDKRGIYSSFVSHHHSSHPRHSLQNSSRYKLPSGVVNTIVSHHKHLLVHLDKSMRVD